jgi:3-carboxy-cis,cis-muconate cycloisomerase
MTVSPFDSEIYRELLFDAEIGEHFGDAAEISAWLRVEAALAQSQGEIGIIPAQSAAAIVQACAGLEVEPASLAAGTGRDGIPIPALVAILQTTLGDEHGPYVHLGATTQDIMDTGLVLRLREVCRIIEFRIRRLLQQMALQAEVHAELPLAARTRAQLATPTSFGAVIAGWGAPLLGQLDALVQLKPRLLRVSLAGASGNASALGPLAAELRAALAAELELGDNEFQWHNDRTGLAEFSAWCTRVNGSLARMAQDYIEAARPEVGEITLTAGGGSSTMPHKNNPVDAETLVSLFQVGAAQDALMTQSLLHRQQRDGVAWSLEWHALPQVCMATAKSLQLAIVLAETLRPDAAAMLARLEDGHGLVYAEAISFRLAGIMPRPEAKAEVRKMCAAAIDQNCSLAEIAGQRFPDIDWRGITIPERQLGDAPRQARAFAARAASL